MEDDRCGCGCIPRDLTHPDLKGIVAASGAGFGAALSAGAALIGASLGGAAILAGTTVFMTSTYGSWGPMSREQLINELDLLRNPDYRLDENGRLIYVPRFDVHEKYKDARQKELDESVNSLPRSVDMCACGSSCPDSKYRPDPTDPYRVPYQLRIPNRLKELYGQAMQQSSPLVFDLNGNGIETTGLEDGTYFDYENEGFAERTGWIAGGDAFLVRDINGNEQIDGGFELFGSNTYLSDGSLAKNGFEALAQFDTNGDGIIDHQDQIWTELRLWRDTNGNGVVDEGELLSLDELGIAGIYVKYVEQNYTDGYGNQHRQIGSFLCNDGREGQIADVWFNTDKTATVYRDQVEVNEEVAQLPYCYGVGNVPDLHQAIMLSEDNRLRQAIDDFLVEDDIAVRNRLITDIIYLWTGVYDIDPRSRGASISDARQLYALEALLGQPFVQGNSTNPGQQASIFLDQAFNEFRELFAATINFQTHYAELYSYCFLEVFLSKALDNH